MGKWALRKRHCAVVLRHRVLSFLSFLRLKNILKKNLERSEPVFIEDVEIFQGYKSILVFPNIHWGYRWQRPQQIFSRLGKKNYNIFYLSPIPSSTEYLKEVSKNVFEVHIKSPEIVNVLRTLELDEELAKDFYTSINNLVGEYLNKESLVFVLHPVWKKVVDMFKGKKIVYDMMDLYSGFKEAKPELVGAEEELVKKSEFVITTADNLYKYAKKLNDNVIMIRNGCDLERFTDIKENGELDCLKDKPIIGYFGAISDWFDVDAMEYAVRNNQDKYFILIGNIDTKKVRKLFRFKNVFFLGEIKHDELGGYLAYFNVCTIPFVLNNLIKSTNPVKFYEYVATGKPVVASRFPELEKYADICYLYDSKEDFSKDIYKALYDDSKDMVEKRKIVAKENSWEERVESLEREIKKI